MSLVAALVATGALAALVPLGARRADEPVHDVAGAVGPATATASARRVPAVIDAVSIGPSGPMSAALIDEAEAVAREINAPSARGRAFNIGMTSVRRGDQYVQLASGPSGRWQFPMGVTALPIDALGRVMSAQVSAAVAAGGVVLGATSASLRGAVAGDVVDLVAANGAIISFPIGYIGSDAEVGGAELVMSPEQADALGATKVTRVLIYGQFSRDALETRLAAHGLFDGVGVRIGRSWAPRNPDSVLSGSRAKQLLGEFDYRVNSDGTLSLDQNWVDSNIVRVSYGDINLRASCHRAVVADIQAALSEIAAAGLSFAVDLSNTNTYGGCWNPRYAVVSSSVGSVSRHAWGMALDMNTVANAQGRVPRMDCRVVRIFRKHNFAWGGNFLVPDGMHFEWVGEPRNTIDYPSPYCPNVPGGGIETNGSGGVDLSASTERDVMFAADGAAGE